MLVNDSKSFIPFLISNLRQLVVFQTEIFIPVLILIMENGIISPQTDQMKIKLVNGILDKKLITAALKLIKNKRKRSGKCQNMWGRERNNTI